MRQLLLMNYIHIKRFAIVVLENRERVEEC